MQQALLGGVRKKIGPGIENSVEDAADEFSDRRKVCR